MNIDNLFTKISRNIRQNHFYQFKSETGDRELNIQFSVTTDYKIVTTYVESQIGKSFNFKPLFGLLFFPDVVFKEDEPLFYCKNREGWFSKTNPSKYKDE